MPDETKAPRSHVERLLRQAGWVLRFERLWPPVVLAGALLAAFVALSWLGVWVVAPRSARILGVALLAAGLVAAGLLAWRTARFTRREALDRLDRDSGLPHRPVSAAEDRLANQGTDPTTRALWDLSRRRLETAVQKVRVAPPSPRMVERDPYALRALAVLGLAAAAFVAGPHKDGLVAAAFDWRGGDGTAGPGFRVDAWVDPPGYTGKPPVVLFGPDQAGQPARTIAVPAHSIVVLRSSGDGLLDVTTTGALAPEAPKPASGGDRAPAATASRDDAWPQAPAPAAKPAGGERRLVLGGDAHLGIGHDGAPLGAVDLHSIPDLPPTIVLEGTPRPTARGALTLTATTNDDYGIASAEAAFSDPMLEGRPAGIRSLVPPPTAPLNLPPTPGGIGKGQTTLDLSDHPWAGAEVTMVLRAHDDGGNVGMSAPVRVVLPSRPFSKPLARALVEQRQNLVFDPDHREPIGTALDALMIAPDTFGTSNAVYLGLYTARQRLDAARTDEDLVALSDYLWQMALKIEDGDRSQTERDLRAAEQDLRDAMQRGASPDEIKKLTEELHRQMEKFLAEMMQKSPDQQAMADNRNSKVITERDLQQMMQRMEESARNGDMAEAQRLLDQLQGILDNLKTARNGSSDQANRDMNREMSELDKMTRDQQALRDKTFKQGKPSRRRQQGLNNKSFGQPQAGQPDDQSDDDSADDQSAQNDESAPPEAGDQAGEDLQGQQNQLSQRLQQMQKRLRDLGMKGEKGFDDAEQAMKDAEGALGQGAPGNRRAVEAQGRALEGLQQGANGMAQQMAQGQSDQSGEGQGQQQGQGDGSGQGQGAQRGDDTDPLGRQRGSRSMETRGAEIGEGVAARAARVLQELRRRLGDPSRPQEEQDYLERLMRRY